MSGLTSTIPANTSGVFSRDRHMSLQRGLQPSASILLEFRIFLGGSTILADQWSVPGGFENETMLLVVYAVGINGRKTPAGSCMTGRSRGKLARIYAHDAAASWNRAKSSNLTDRCQRMIDDRRKIGSCSPTLSRVNCAACSVLPLRMYGVLGNKRPSSAAIDACRFHQQQACRTVA
jgi:hypothetical protein